MAPLKKTGATNVDSPPTSHQCPPSQICSAASTAEIFRTELWIRASPLYRPQQSLAWVPSPATEMMEMMVAVVPVVVVWAAVLVAMTLSVARAVAVSRRAHSLRGC